MINFYGIRCKTMDRFNTFISSVGMSYIGTDGKATGYRSYSRDDVLALIHAGHKVYTIILPDGKWVLGEEVRPFAVNGVTYLRTVANKEERDNLDNLPNC
jgi:hypothetical protein